MKLSRFHWVTVALAVAMTIFGLWSFAITLPPIPEPMLRVSGTVASAEAKFRKGNISVIVFKVAPSGKAFAYHSILPQPQHVWDAIDRHLPVEVLYTDPLAPELWGLVVSGKTLLTPQSAYSARRENGYWGLALAALSFGGLLYMLFVEGRRHAA